MMSCHLPMVLRPGCDNNTGMIISLPWAVSKDCVLDAELQILSPLLTLELNVFLPPFSLYAVCRMNDQLIFFLTSMILWPRKTDILLSE